MCERQAHDDQSDRDDHFGISLLVVSAMAFSAAGFFTRMVPVAPPAMIFWRNLFGCIGIAAQLMIRGPGLTMEFRRLDRASWAAATVSAASMTCYVSAFAYTSVANVSIIYATAPVITAVLAWIGLGERLMPRTALAACLVFAGVVMTVAGSASSTSIVGDGLALLMTVGLSVVAVLVRGSRPTAGPTALAAAGLATLGALPFAAVTGAGLRIGLQDAAWLAAFGVLTISLAWPLSLAGTARVPAARAMLISALELPLAPFWVWLAVGEVPSGNALAGGACVLAAVLWDVTAFPARRPKRA